MSIALRPYGMDVGAEAALAGRPGEPPKPSREALGSEERKEEGIEERRIEE